MWKRFIWRIKKDFCKLFYGCGENNFCENNLRREKVFQNIISGNRKFPKFAMKERFLIERRSITKLLIWLSKKRAGLDLGSRKNFMGLPTEKWKCILYWEENWKFISIEVTFQIEVWDFCLWKYILWKDNLSWTCNLWKGLLLGKPMGKEKNLKKPKMEKIAWERLF